jgi:hypothetical protein
MSLYNWHPFFTAATAAFAAASRVNGSIYSSAEANQLPKTIPDPTLKVPPLLF